MDAQLAQQLAAGDPTAGPLLVSYVGPKLAGYAQNIADDLMPADREMLVERALAAVVRHIDEYDPARSSLATWARPFLRLALHGWRRVHRSGPPVPLDPLPDFADEAPEPPDPVSERRIAAVESLLPDLPSTTELIIQLHLGERLTFRQIAEVLEQDDQHAKTLTEAACRKRYDRAIHKLRSLAQNHPDLQDLT